VWLFSVGSFGDRHPIVCGLIKKEPKEISEFEQTLHPRDYRVFAGVIDLDHWPAWGRLLFKALGGHAGDNRQWPDIDAWAERIAGGSSAGLIRPIIMSARPHAPSADENTTGA
jgi:menaquinone-dependent protoporphyrinogen oxidase